MSASAESRGLGGMPMRFLPAVTVRPRDALDPHGPTETLFNYAATLTRDHARTLGVPVSDPDQNATPPHGIAVQTTTVRTQLERDAARRIRSVEVRLTGLREINNPGRVLTYWELDSALKDIAVALQSLDTAIEIGGNQ